MCLFWPIGELSLTSPKWLSMSSWLLPSRKLPDPIFLTPWWSLRIPSVNFDSQAISLWYWFTSDNIFLHHDCSMTTSSDVSKCHIRVTVCGFEVLWRKSINDCLSMCYHMCVGFLIQGRQIMLNCDVTETLVSTVMESACPCFCLITLPLYNRWSIEGAAVR